MNTVDLTRIATAIFKIVIRLSDVGVQILRNATVMDAHPPADIPILLATLTIQRRSGAAADVWRVKESTLWPLWVSSRAAMHRESQRSIIDSEPSR